jgi:hypothetical protein
MMLSAHCTKPTRIIAVHTGLLCQPVSAHVISLILINPTGAQTLPKFDIREYARQGAQARAAELEAELAQIYRAFPDLRGGTSQRRAAGPARRRRRKPMTAAQKKAVSARMKKYWAARRKAQS